MNGVAFQPKIFANFVGLLARYFYDDASIVLLDYFAIANRALSEAELLEKMRWRENLMVHVLNKLEQQYVLERIIEVERGSKTFHLWRIHPHICAITEWKYKAFMEKLYNDIESTNKLNHLVCPECNIDVSLFDAASGPKAEDDQHPLCPECSSKLKICNMEELRLKCENRCNIALKAFKTLDDFLSRVRDMQVPAFTSIPWESTDLISTNEVVNNNLQEINDEKNIKLGNDQKQIPWFDNDFNFNETNKMNSVFQNDESKNFIDFDKFISSKSDDFFDKEFGNSMKNYNKNSVDQNTLLSSAINSNDTLKNTDSDKIKVKKPLTINFINNQSELSINSSLTKIRKQTKRVNKQTLAGAFEKRVRLG